MTVLWRVLIVWRLMGRVDFDLAPLGSVIHHGRDDHRRRREVELMDVAPVTDVDGPRFLQLSDVAQVLAVSDTQVYALVRSGDLRAIKLGGRGRWRVERSELQAYIDRMYDQTRAFIDAHPFSRAELDAVED
jgi:excisionase family DNA binding protein